MQNSSNPTETIQERARSLAAAKAAGLAAPAATTSATGTATADPSNLNPDLCWFCTKAEAKNGDFHFKVPLYRGREAGTEENEKGVTVKKYEWNAIKFPVPRCEQCNNTHHNLPWVKSGPTLVAFLAFAAGMYWTVRDHNLDKLVEGIWKQTNTVDLTPMLEMAAYGCCGVIFSVALSRYLLKRIDARVPGELYARHYPVLQKLISEGWKLGVNPATKSAGGAALAEKASK